MPSHHTGQPMEYSVTPTWTGWRWEKTLDTPNKSITQSIWHAQFGRRNGYNTVWAPLRLASNVCYFWTNQTKQRNWNIMCFCTRKSSNSMWWKLKIGGLDFTHFCKTFCFSAQKEAVKWMFLQPGILSTPWWGLTMAMRFINCSVLVCFCVLLVWFCLPDDIFWFPLYLFYDPTLLYLLRLFWQASLTLCMTTCPVQIRFTILTPYKTKCLLQIRFAIFSQDVSCFLFRTGLAVWSRSTWSCWWVWWRGCLKKPPGDFCPK